MFNFNTVVMKKILFSFLVLMLAGWSLGQVFEEDFESGNMPPEGWTLESSNANFTWNSYAAGPISGNYSASVEYDESLVPQDEKLISPVIDLSTSASALLTFKVSMSYYWSVDPNDNYDFNVLVSTDGGATWTQVWNEHDYGVFESYTPFNVQVSLDEYIGNNNVQLAFQYIGSDGAQVILDDIVIYEDGEAPNCPSLVAPLDGATELDPVGLNFEWLPAEGDAVDNYSIWIGTDMDNLENIGSIEATNVEITGLGYSTTYYWTITANNPFGSSDACNIYSFTTMASVFEPYCGPLAFSFIEPITHVNFAGIDNSSSDESEVAHENFMDISGNVTPGETYTVTIQGNTAGDYDNTILVFIDWDQNNVLDDVDEMYQLPILSNSTGTDGISVAMDITVPESAVQGETRMRVKKIYGTTNLEDPCLGTSFGQAEDYTILVGTMGVNDVTSSKFSVYPNPAKSIVNLKGFDAEKVRVYNMLGQEVRVSFSNNTINVEKLPIGNYVIQAENAEGEIQTVKFIKK